MTQLTIKCVIREISTFYSVRARMCMCGSGSSILRSWREFAKSRFTHFPSILSVHVDSYDNCVLLPSSSHCLTIWVVSMSLSGALANTDAWVTLVVSLINIYLFILDPVGPMIQRHIQEKVHAFVTTSSSSRSPTLSGSHNLAWHIVQQSLHEGQPDQLTRGPHWQLEERRPNTPENGHIPSSKEPHSYATTTRQTMRGPRQTTCR